MHTIIVTVKGGMVAMVENIPPDTIVQIRDYDVPTIEDVEAEEIEVRADAEGDRYVASDWLSWP